MMVKEVSMKWMDGPSVTEMEGEGVYEMAWHKNGQKNGNATEMDKM